MHIKPQLEIQKPRINGVALERTGMLKSNTKEHDSCCHSPPTAKTVCLSKIIQYEIMGESKNLLMWGKNPTRFIYIAALIKK